MTSAATCTASLAGRRILVAEDEYMIADLIAETLSNAGVQMLGPVGSVAEALHLVASSSETNRIDAALLDVDLHGEAIWPVVDALLARDVPVVLATGYDAGIIPQAYAYLPLCEKPATGRELTRTLSYALYGPNVIA